MLSVWLCFDMFSNKAFVPFSLPAMLEPKASSSVGLIAGRFISFMFSHIESIEPTLRGSPAESLAFSFCSFSKDIRRRWRTTGDFGVVEVAKTAFASPSLFRPPSISIDGDERVDLLLETTLVSHIAIILPTLACGDSLRSPLVARPLDKEPLETRISFLALFRFGSDFLTAFFSLLLEKTDSSAS